MVNAKVPEICIVFNGHQGVTSVVARKTFGPMEVHG